VLSDIPFKAILTSEEKILLLEKMGVKLFIEYPFEALAHMTPDRFVRDILVGRLRASVIVAGEDYRFGKGGHGDVNALCELGKSLGFEMRIIPHIMDGGSKISSSRVREAVALTDFETASRLLGRPYFVMGEVIRGNMLGRKMGVPTANLMPDKHKLLPPPGVYSTDVMLDGRKFRGMTNIGTRPTVTNDKDVVVETHLLDFDDDIYGQTITVEFGRWIRAEKRFGGVDELKEQLMKDMDIIKTNPHQTRSSGTPD
jgi:riboflavin kinase/FMN adenylyltransferase